MSSGARVRISRDVYLKLFEFDGDLVRRRLRDYGTMYLDEAQDLNRVMRSIAQKARITLVAVGYPWQQIYAFRGAEDALDLLPGEPLHLSQSFRFGEAIAAAARAVLASKPSSRPTVPLRGSDKRGQVVESRPARVTLCRSNAGVFSAAVTSARAGTGVHVIGGIDDLSDELESAVALFEGHLGDVEDGQLEAVCELDRPQNRCRRVR